jgi:hypothetical protein
MDKIGSVYRIILGPELFLARGFGDLNETFRNRLVEFHAALAFAWPRICRPPASPHPLRLCSHHQEDVVIVDQPEVAAGCANRRRLALTASQARMGRG